MALVNLANVRYFRMKTTMSNLVVPFSNVIYNEIGTQYTLKVNSISLTNYSTTPANVWIVSYDYTSNEFANINRITVLGQNTVYPIDRNSPIVIKDGDYIRANADANNRITSFIHYEKYSENENIVEFPPFTLSYLLVAGGGGADSASRTAGAGAGGLLCGSILASSSTNYSIIVGGGGAKDAPHDSTADGSCTTALGMTAFGGGRGGGQDTPGRPGGSGGGGGGWTGDCGAGCPGQGNPGGLGLGCNTPPWSGGGGGGAGELGYRACIGFACCAKGGIGCLISISGTPTYYGGGGGGGGGWGGSPSFGGCGGGGYAPTCGGAGGINTGGGAGAGSSCAQGGSGIVIFCYPLPQVATGGNITCVGGSIIHTFTSSGTFATCGSGAY